MRYLLLFLVHITPYTCLFQANSVIISTDPIFETTPRNITAIAGETINLPCSVENKGSYNLIWMNPRVTLISKDDSRYIDDSRISVERPKTKDWNLMIREVRYNDSGEYMCQINTNPVRIKRLYLYVKVSPEFIEDMSPTVFSVVEGTTVTLVCNATGVPMPVVTWYKQHKLLKDYNDAENGRESTLIGEMMILRNVSRYCDGTYECNAENGVPPIATRQFQVTVRFPPEVTLTNKRMSQYRGKETILECKVSASPHAYMTWTKNGSKLPDMYKYRENIYGSIGSTEKTLQLRIIDLDKHDFGEYKCEASNPLGSDVETMLLYELEPPKKRIYTTPWLPTQVPTVQRPLYPNNAIITSPRYAGSRHNNRGNGQYDNFRSSAAQKSMTSTALMTFTISYLLWHQNLVWR